MGSFAHGTITKRLPAIVANMLKDVEKLYDEPGASEALLSQVGGGRGINALSQVGGTGVWGGGIDVLSQVGGPGVWGGN